MGKRSSNLEGLQVLIVDDRVEDCWLLNALLDFYGIKVKIANSAQEAFNLLRNWTADIVISDLAMPEEDGYSLIRRIRSLAPHQGGKMPAIALTAFAVPEARQQALDAGFQAFLTKPLEPDHLVRTLVDLAPSSLEFA